MTVPKIGIAYDVGGRGDLSFNDSAYEGLEKAVEEFDATCTEAEAGTGRERRGPGGAAPPARGRGLRPHPRHRASSTPRTSRWSPRSTPTSSFAVVDGYVTFANEKGAFEPVENAIDLNFAAEQGSFLVGAAAALKTEDRHGRLPRRRERPAHPGLRGRLQGGSQGGGPEGQGRSPPTCRRATPQQGFENRSGGKTASDGLYDDGADIIYHAAGKSGLGLFDSVAEQGEGKWAIGVDSDQYLTASEDAAAAHPDLDAQARRRERLRLHRRRSSTTSSKGGIVNYDLKGDGVGYSTSGGFVDDIEDQLQDYADADRER